jgi:signal transduction histidine kinase
LVEAAHRVEDGDLDFHVHPRGPRDLRALARAFNSMLDRLRQNERQRRQLLADVTHELRTPVAVLQGNLEAIVDGVYAADAEHLGPLLEETRLLSRLIDDLRTLSLVESGALELHREPTDMGVLVGDVITAFRAQAEAAGVALRAEIPDDLSLADVDPLRVREVLANLTANALRHTPHGGDVRISAAAAPGGLRFSVTDTGTGISAEDLPHIFERYYKTADSTGSGLGLAIARNLVLLHGGEIGAESPPGCGTTIWFTLPLEAPSIPGR